CVLQEDARQVTDALQQTHLPLRERSPRPPPDREEATERPVLDPDRHEDIGLVRKVTEGLAIHPGGARYVVGPYGAPLGHAYSMASWFLRGIGIRRKASSMSRGT